MSIPLNASYSLLPVFDNTNKSEGVKMILFSRWPLEYLRQHMQKGNNATEQSNKKQRITEKNKEIVILSNKFK